MPDVSNDNDNDNENDPILAHPSVVRVRAWGSEGAAAAWAARGAADWLVLTLLLRRAETAAPPPAA